MFYDRLHYCIIEFFVLPVARIPRIWVGRTVDDLTSVIPAQCASLADRFVETYRKVLKDLNIGAAVVDPEMRKAFDGNTSEEMLGVWFYTESGTWNLP